MEFPVLYSRFSLVIYFMCSIESVPMSVPISQFLPLPLPLLVSTRLFSVPVLLFLLHKYAHLYCFSFFSLFIF